ncbi:hypothetical protein DRE_04363 [Drechslerella stenobrocha 248]|uniref:Uncharacterized protein n=1 Tax=Drechslerella stenobrocha 248 TaxID=1043628 RepID=W7IBE0_9PEZI|nr:hypothetical protein DRE_04363 [Drechslerella stenobrocha 248]
MCTFNIGSFSSCGHRVEDIGRCAQGLPPVGSREFIQHVTTTYYRIHGDCHECKWGLEDVEKDLSAMWQRGLQMTANPVLAYGTGGRSPKRLPWETMQRFLEVRKEWEEGGARAIVRKTGFGPAGELPEQEEEEEERVENGKEGEASTGGGSVGVQWEAYSELKSL